MAYGLSLYATADFKSMNGTDYDVEIWWVGTGASEEWTLGGGGPAITYETEGADDKNSPILTSKLTLPVMITNTTIENFIDGLRTTYQEKDAWVVIKNSASTAPIWCGYLLLDLESREDVSIPYETRLVAVDGLSVLKDKPFVRETDSITGAATAYPYIRSNTWSDSGYQTIIGSANSWITRILSKAGNLVAADSTTGTLQNYTIQTAVNWYNTAHPTPADDIDPLRYTKINMHPLYTIDGDNYYNPPSYYDVLEHICRSFNMRCVYWQHAFHFIQLSEYNTDENAAGTPASPINIPTRVYYHSGTSKSNQNYIGTNNLSLYNMDLENATNPSKGLLKLTGTKYDALPPIKQVSNFYSEKAGVNSFNGFPLLPSSWSTGTYNQLPLDGNGVGVTMQFTDADTFDGWVCKIPLNFTNTSSADLVVECVWNMRAKPVSSAWGDGDNKTLIKYTSAPTFDTRWVSYQFPVTNNQECIRTYATVSGTNNNANNTLFIFDSATDSICAQTSGMIPTHGDFTGDWDFQFFTFTYYNSTQAYPMNAANGGYTAGYSHGRVTSIVGGTGVNFDGSASNTGQKPPDYALDYTNVINQQTTPAFNAMFNPVVSGTSASNLGNEVVVTQIITNRSDSFIYNIGEIMWGDGTGANARSTMQVSANGSTWTYVSSSGVWAKAVYTWNAVTSEYDYVVSSFDKKITTLLSEEILNNQNIPIFKFNGATVLSVNDKFYTGTTKLKFMNPIAKLTDVDDKEYLFMRGTFNMLSDEWHGEWGQVKYVTATITSGENPIQTIGM